MLEVFVSLLLTVKQTLSPQLKLILERLLLPVQIQENAK